MNKRLFKSITLTGFTLLIIYIGFKTYQLMTTAAGWYSPVRLLLLLIGFGIGLLVLWLAVYIFLFLPDCYAGLEKHIIEFREKNKFITWSLVTLFSAIPSILIFFSSIFNLQTMNHEPILFPQYRFVAYLITSVIAAIFLTSDNRKLISLPKLTLAFLFSGFLFVLTMYYHNIVTYPFSLSWAEGNRMWYHSLLFGRDRYNHTDDQIIYPLTTPGRQTLWGLAYLIPGLSIWGIRLWTAIVWTVPYIILGLMLFKNKEDSQNLMLLTSMWVLLFLQQGQILPPIVLCAILVAGSRRKNILLSFVLVGLSGYYAHLSRFTWVLAPAMWIGMWTLGKATLEKNTISKKIWVRAIILVIAGLIGGVILPLVLKTDQALTAGGISTSLTQHPLIWSRLWPTPTFAPGIVLGLLIAITPVLIFLGHMLITKSLRLNFWQSLAIGGGLLAFLVVGLIASVKMGGGGDLHNLDLFLIGLLFVGDVAWDKGGLEWIQKQDKSLWKMVIPLMAVLLPIIQPLANSQRLDLPDKEITQIMLEDISDKVSSAAINGEVLFLDQRQLLTFGYVEKIPLVDEYPKKIVMNKAMEEDKIYFEGFYRDLANHRFSLIITQPLKTSSFSQGEHEFGLEHNAWLEWVDEPLLCFYQQEFIFKKVGVILLIPREEPCKDADQYESLISD